MATAAYTALAYLRSLKTIYKLCGVTPIPDVPDVAMLCQQANEVINKIDTSDYANNSKKLLYIALVSSIKKDPELMVAYDDALERFKRKMDELNFRIQHAAQEQVLSPAEETKYLEWPEVLETVEKIRVAVDSPETFQQYLIACLYTMTAPVRLDYANMVITRDPELPTDTSQNYLVWSDLAKYFVFNTYKTSKKFGSQVIQVPLQLQEVIKEWFELADPGHLLIDSAGEGMPEWLLGQTLISVFEKHSGKKVGANILRHSYASWMRKGELSIKQSASLAQQMLHSPQMSQLYRRLDVSSTTQ